MSCRTNNTGETNESSIFRALADDQTRPLPYDTELAGQRAKYGEGLLRKAPEQLHRQELYEGEAKARVEEARAARAAEQAKIEAREVRLESVAELTNSVNAVQRLSAKLLNWLKRVLKLVSRLVSGRRSSQGSRWKKRTRRLNGLRSESGLLRTERVAVDASASLEEGARSRIPRAKRAVRRRKRRR